MKAIDILAQPTIDTFNEQGYLFCNEDVRNVILNQGDFKSGKEHFIRYGEQENRNQLDINSIRALKEQKIPRIKNLLKQEEDLEQRLEGISELSDACFYNFLDEDIKKVFQIVDTANVSQNPYDAIALKLINYYQNGNILDFGAGFRRFNYSNVVNYEIVKYISTDVVGVGEKLPFKDSVFDCIFSFAVLEHVKDPFACAKEIVRCLKPGGMLYVVVPHLQPYHGYPHHYYNMTHQGLANLFSNLDFKHQEVNRGNTVIWSVSWTLKRWVDSLPRNLRHQLVNLKVSDLIAPTIDFIEKYPQLLRSIPPEVQLEIAAATSLIATKPSLENASGDRADRDCAALEEIIEVLTPQYLTPENLQLYASVQSNQVESLNDNLVVNTTSQISFGQKVEHILRTTLHYYRLWKREVFNLDQN